MTNSNGSPERPEKVLSRLGMGSRREIARWVDEGRLSVRGRTLRGGERVSALGELCLDGKPLRIPKELYVRQEVIVYNKPIGELVTRRDPGGRPTVFSALPKLSSGRWVAVGRLDAMTTGLLLFSTDGELASRLMHPRSGIIRRYLVRIDGRLSPEQVSKLTRGIELEDGPAHFEELVHVRAREGRNQWYRIGLTEGRNREVRRLFAAENLQVSRLVRVAFGPIELPRDLRQGQWSHLDAAQILQLRAAVGTNGGQLA